VATGKIQHPYGSFRFKLEVDGIALGHFKSCSGLSHEIEVLEFQEGGVNEFKHKLVGQGSYPNITLKMGFVSNGLAEDWHYEYATADAKKGQRKTVRIYLLDDDVSTVVGEWTLQNAWPVKWEGPEFDASGDNLAVETLEIAHHGILRANQKAATELDPTKAITGKIKGGKGRASLRGAIAKAVANMPRPPNVPNAPNIPSVAGTSPLNSPPPTDPRAAAEAALNRARQGAKTAARNAMPRNPFA
jgi:phage tail-like protein